MKEVKIQVPDGHELVQDGNTYTIKEKSKYPTSWEGLESIIGYWVTDGCNIFAYYGGSPVMSNKHVYATLEQAEASVAQAQITQLLKAYNGDWKADWNYGNEKHAIGLIYNQWGKTTAIYHSQFLTFKTQEARDHFFEHHMDLLNKYKPLAG